MVIAIHLTQSTARRAFDHATSGLAGSATHQVRSLSGHLPESLYAKIRTEHKIRQSAPLLELQVSLGSADSHSSVRLLGIDPIAEGSLRNVWFTGFASAQNQTLTELITNPDTALISSPLAQRLGLLPGDSIAVSVGTGTHSLKIIGTLDPERRQAALHASDLILTDIATAQELGNAIGKLSRIDLILDSKRKTALEQTLPDEIILESVSSQREALDNMTRAFHTNLTALSLLALMVGIFLVYNSQSFAIVQRRRQFSILRALGVRRRELLQVILSEALVFGALGAGLGWILGVLLARGLVQLVARTINDLYFRVSIGQIGVEPESLLLALGLGIAGALIAALVPAMAASAIEPRLGLQRSALESNARKFIRHACLLSAVITLVGIASLNAGGDSLAMGFAGLFALLLAVALLTPALLLAVAHIASRIRALQRRPAASLLLASLGGSPSRTGIATAVLTVAVASTIGIGVMVQSFRLSVADWLNSVLQAHYYLSVDSSGQLTTDSLPLLKTLPAVTDVTSVYQTQVRTQFGSTNLNAYQLNNAAANGFPLLQVAGSAEQFWSDMKSTATVMISEPMARKRKLKAGDALELQTPAGRKIYRIGAVYRDYGSDQGTISMTREQFALSWPDANAVTGIGLYLAPEWLDNTTLDTELRTAVLEKLDQSIAIDLVSNQQIKTRSLEVFDQTFAITNVLRIIAAAVAMIGTFSALLAIQLERSRELAVLRAIGVSPGQMHQIVIGESSLIGLIAGLVAIPAGLMVAWCLIVIINQRAFGWSMEMFADPGQIASGFVMAVFAAMLAGWYPARRALQIEPATAMRVE